MKSNISSDILVFKPNTKVRFKYSNSNKNVGTIIKYDHYSKIVKIKTDIDSILISVNDVLEIMFT